MADQQRPTVRRRRLGRIMRNIRESRGLTIPDAAKLLNRDVSAISRLETGHRGIRRPSLENMLDHYGITDQGFRQQLFDLARSSYRKGWWQDYDGTISPELMDFLSLEAEAVLIEFFELVLIPGLLQTEAYARALMRTGPFALDPDHVERLVNIRLRRQAILTKPNPPRLFAIADEAALHRPVGGRQVMRAQLRHMVELAQLPNLSMQVLPYSAGEHPGLDGSFKNLRIGANGNLRVVVIDTLTQVSYREQQHEIQAYADAFSRLRTASLPEADSRELIQRLMSEI